MPPPEAVKAGKVKPLSDEDRRTITRWIDLGCPIDLDYDPHNPAKRGYGWMLDDNRPTLALTYPAPGANCGAVAHPGRHARLRQRPEPRQLPRRGRLRGRRPAGGTNLAGKFQQKASGVWELRLAKPIGRLEKGKLTVSVADRQGNITQIERTFTVGRDMP